MYKHILENPARLQKYRRLSGLICEARNLAEELAEAEDAELDRIMAVDPDSPLADESPLAEAVLDELEALNEHRQQLIYDLQENAAKLETVEQFIDELLED